MIKIKRGLDLPIAGVPGQTIEDGPTPRTVAVVGQDYVGMKPTMVVAEGDNVIKGQVLFTDKKTEGVKYTAPASGRVAAINRGHKRVLQSLVIDVKGDDGIEFKSYGDAELAGLSQEQVQENLIESGLWTALRQRPYSKVPSPESTPTSIFVTAMDTNPLAADPQVVLAERQKDWENGLTVLKRLRDVPVYVCKKAGSPISAAGGAEAKEFDGPHPAGLAGTHIHFVDPVYGHKAVWYVNYQDVLAIGALFTTGQLDTRRVISLAGPQVEKPRLLRTCIGASIDEITAGALKQGESRVISGSVLSGYTARGPYAYLGRYHAQISVIREGRERVFMEYMSPGARKHSQMNIYLSNILPKKLLELTSNTNGSPRGMVPIGAYEGIMPLDVLPTQLLRALIVGDTATAQDLGALELDEEDLGLCTYVCPGKYEFGPILRDNLTRIEKEG